MTRWFPRLMIVTASVQFVLFGVRPFISYQALSLGASAAQLGVIIASFSVLSLGAAIPLGRLVDRHGERPFVLAGTAILTAVPVLLIYSRNLVVLAIISAALGLGHLCAMVGIQTLIARGEEAERRDRRFSTFTLVNSVGQLVAPAIAGFVVGDVVAGGQEGLAHFAGAYVLCAGVAGLGIAVAISLLLRGGTLTQRPAVGATTPRAFSKVIRIPSVPIALMASFTSLSAIDLLAAYLPAYAQSIGIPVRTVGLLLAAFGLASVVVRLVMMKLLTRFSRIGLLTVSMLLPAAGLAVLPFLDSSAGLLVVMVVTGLGLGLCQPITMGWVASTVPREIRGTAMSIRLAGNRLGQTLVPLGVGVVAAGAAGLAGAFLTPAALLAISAVLVHRTGRRRPA